MLVLYRYNPTQRRQFNHRPMNASMPHFIRRYANFYFDHLTVANLFPAQRPRHGDIVHAPHYKYQFDKTRPNAEVRGVDIHVQGQVRPAVYERLVKPVKKVVLTLVTSRCRRIFSEKRRRGGKGSASTTKPPRTIVALPKRPNIIELKKKRTAKFILCSP